MGRKFYNKVRILLLQTEDMPESSQLRIKYLANDLIDVVLIVA